METDLDDEGLDSDKRLDDLANHSLESYRRMGGNQGDTWLRGVNHGLMYVMTIKICLLYTSPSPRDLSTSRMPSSA